MASAVRNCLQWRMRGLNSIRATSCLHSWTAVLSHSLACRGQGQAAAQAVEAQAAELPAAEPGRPLRRTRGLWGATGVRRPGGPETLVVPPAVPLGGPAAAVEEGGRSGAGASASGGGGADTASSKASTSMADLTRVLHVSLPARAAPGLGRFHSAHGRTRTDNALPRVSGCNTS